MDYWIIGLFESLLDYWIGWKTFWVVFCLLKIAPKYIDEISVAYCHKPRWLGCRELKAWGEKLEPPVMGRTTNGFLSIFPSDHEGSLVKSVTSQVLDGSNSSNRGSNHAIHWRTPLDVLPPGGAEASDSQWQDALRGDQIAAGPKWWFSLISNDFERVNWINHGIYGIGDLFWWLSSLLTGPGLFEVLARSFVWERLQKATKASFIVPLTRKVKKNP